MKNDEQNLKAQNEDRSTFTFKITKRRTPWSIEVIFFLILGRFSHK
jgi:hypothetical protein